MKNIFDRFHTLFCIRAFFHTLFWNSALFEQNLRRFFKYGEKVSVENARGPTDVFPIDTCLYKKQVGPGRYWRPSAFASFFFLFLLFDFFFVWDTPSQWCSTFKMMFFSKRTRNFVSKTCNFVTSLLLIHQQNDVSHPKWYSFLSFFFVSF